MEVKVFNLYSNCNVIWDVESGEAAVIDCGECCDELLRFIEKEKLKLKYFLMTHGHFDHVYGISDLKQRFPDVPAYISRNELPRLPENPEFGKELEDLNPPESYSAFISQVQEVENVEINLNGNVLKIFSSPGHTEGSILYYNEEHKIMFTGDTIFEYRTGMTTFKSGNKETMLQTLQNIRQKFVGQNYTVYAGHYNTFKLDENIANIEQNVY